MIKWELWLKMTLSLCTPSIPDAEVIYSIWCEGRQSETRGKRKRDEPSLKYKEKEEAAADVFCRLRNVIPLWALCQYIPDTPSKTDLLFHSLNFISLNNNELALSNGGWSPNSSSQMMSWTRADPRSPELWRSQRRPNGSSRKCSPPHSPI